jgi:hypothetical protein
MSVAPQDIAARRFRPIRHADQHIGLRIAEELARIADAIEKET